MKGKPGISSGGPGEPAGEILEDVDERVAVEQVSPCS